MTLDELDRLAAKRIMGWQYVPASNLIQSHYLDEGSVVHDGYGDSQSYFWKPTRNIAQAWELLEKVGRHFYIKRTNHFDNGTIFHKMYRAGIRRESGRGDETADADTAPEAITKACLKAKGVGID